MSANDCKVNSYIMKLRELKRQKLFWRSRRGGNKVPSDVCKVLCYLLFLSAAEWQAWLLLCTCNLLSGLTWERGCWKYSLIYSVGLTFHQLKRS